MNETLKTIMDDVQISEPELVEFIYVYSKLVKGGYKCTTGFNNTLDKFGIVWDGDKKFTFSDDTEYTFN